MAGWDDEHASQVHLSVQAAVDAVRGPRSTLASGDLIFGTDADRQRWADAALAAGWTVDHRGRLTAPDTDETGAPISVCLVVR